MSGVLVQLVANGMFDNHITNNDKRYSIENKTLIFNNSVCSIDRYGHFFLPKKIVCYNCNNDFKIKEIELEIGGNSNIINIDTDIMNNYNIYQIPNE